MSQTQKQNFIIVLGMLGAIMLVVFFSFLKSAPSTSTLFLNKDSKKETALPHNVNPLVTNAPDYWPQGLTQPTVTSISPQKGSRQNAKIALIEFSDLGCPYCQRMHQAIENVISQFPDDIVWVWKDLPVTHLHGASRDAHIASRCAWKQNQFWPYIKKIFENQNSFQDELYKKIAAELELNMASFSSCLEKKDVLMFVDYDIEEARALGVSGTPYLFLVPQNQSESKRINGAVTEEELLKIISELLPNNSSESL